MNRTSAENKTKPNRRDDERCESGDHRNGSRWYKGVNCNRALRSGELDESRRSIGSYDCDVTREETVESEFGVVLYSESDNERRRFSMSIAVS